MARALSVKVPTANLIALVEQKIVDLEAKIASYPADLKAYKESYKAYKQELLSVALEAIRSNPELLNDPEAIGVSMSYNNRDVNLSFNVVAFALPTEPVRPSDPNERVYNRSIGEYTFRIDVLKKNLAILKMTTQEEVNASTYSSVMELL